MKYYKVKKEADQELRPDRSIYIANELYTPNEVEKLGLNTEYLVPVEVSKKKVYWFFGARFEDKKPQKNNGK